MDFAKIAPKFFENLLNWNEFEFKIWSKSATDSFIALFPLHYPSLSDLYEFIFFVGSLFWLKTIIVEIVFPRKIELFSGMFIVY